MAKRRELYKKEKCIKKETFQKKKKNLEKRRKKDDVGKKSLVKYIYGVSFPQLIVLLKAK